MKKLVSVLCVLTLLVSMFAISAVSANAEGEVTKGATAVDVKSGDEVSYSLMLERVEQPIIGSDFSVYYDSSVFDLVSVADFNNQTDEAEWEATINPDLDGQVRGVWSILKGVDFSSKRNFITVNLKAKTDAQNSHITYRIRYLYDNDVFNSSDYPQITNYLFTCDLKVNGEEVLKDAAPEVNVDEEPENGKFVESLDGDSEHADANIPGVYDKTKENADNSGSGNNYGSGNNNGSGNDQSANGGAANGGAAGNVSGGNNAAANNQAAANVTTAPPATTAEGYYITATDAQGKVTATSDEAPVVPSDNGKGGSSPVLWIIIALVVLAGGGAAAYYYMKKKPAGEATADAAAAEKDASVTQAKDAAEENKD